MIQPRQTQVERELNKALDLVPSHHAEGQAFVDVDVGTSHDNLGTGQVQVISVDHNVKLVGVG